MPEPYESRHEPADLRLRPNVPAASEAAAREQLAGYYRLIENLDDNVGRVLDWLDSNGLAENTIVVFLSDHGEMGGSHGLRDKQVPYEESLHVPAMWRWPGRLPAGTDRDGLTCGVDFLPTTAGLCGVPLTAPVDGLDLSNGFLHGSDGPSREGVMVQWEDTRFAFGDHPYRALRTRTHTYVVGRDEAFCMLFDLNADPYQQRNLFSDPASSEVRRHLHAELLRTMGELSAPVPAYVRGASG